MHGLLTFVLIPNNQGKPPIKEPVVSAELSECKDTAESERNLFHLQILPLWKYELS